MMIIIGFVFVFVLDMPLRRLRILPLKKQIYPMFLFLNTIYILKKEVCTFATRLREISGTQTRVFMFVTGSWEINSTQTQKSWYNNQD